VRTLLNGEPATFDQGVEANLAWLPVAGDAQDVREQLQQLYANPRLGRIILTPQISGEGARPMADVIQEFGETVLAHL
jgi:alkanesulfonate monooxygenase SsuD/methylene tetrahydromethanopterin reductase-like flavin-dependent oxidoreductase (luciferase family)